MDDNVSYVTLVKEHFCETIVTYLFYLRVLFCPIVSFMIIIVKKIINEKLDTFHTMVKKIIIVFYVPLVLTVIVPF